MGEISGSNNERMNLTKRCIIRAVLVTAVCFFVIHSCSFQAENTKDSLDSTPKGEPVKIGVCMPSSGPLAVLASSHADGIRAAARFAPAVDGRPIAVIFRDYGDSVQEFRKTLEELIGRDRVSAVITCIRPEAVPELQDYLKSVKVPLILTKPFYPSRKIEEAPNIINLATTLEDQAFAGARFATETLRGRRIGIILDADDKMSVRLASLFSHNVVKSSGSIVDIAYLSKNADPAADLSRVVGKKPDALYIPYSSSVSADLVAKVRALDTEVPMLISNIQKEDKLLSSRERFKRVYLLTDFHEEAVRCVRGRNFVDFYHQTLKRKGYLSSSIAMGADAYFLSVDLTMNAFPQDGGKAGEIDWNTSMLRIIGVRSSGAVRDQMSVGLMDKIFLREPTLKYVGQVAVSGLKPAADVRAQ
jgi:ABC-type branched-subunit amino acid transport system substrate-binding protein